MSDTPHLLLIDTSQRRCLLGLAAGASVVDQRCLGEPRRHGRELVPALKEMLAAQGWTPQGLHAVAVSIGPGSYTGLRVGIMSAKTLAYAARLPLLAVETFATLARQMPDEAQHVAVISDAQQDKLYVQRFQRDAVSCWQPESSLSIQPFDEFSAALAPRTWVQGPGLEIFGSRLGQARLAPADSWLPGMESLLAEALARWQAGDMADPFALEPLYLRPSAAEQQWEKLGRA